MEGNIVAAYSTKWGTCLVSDAAYATRTTEELERTRNNISAVARGVLTQLAREGRLEKMPDYKPPEDDTVEIPRSRWPEEWQKTKEMKP